MTRVSWPIKKGKLSPQDKRDLLSMGEAGKGPSLIARTLHLHPSTVHYHLVMAGLTGAPVRRSFCYQRRGRTVKSFSEEEDRFIEELRSSGTGYPEIARLASERFGHTRKPHSIMIRIVQLANREDGETA